MVSRLSKRLLVVAFTVILFVSAIAVTPAAGVASDEWPDSGSAAPTVTPNQTINGTIDTTDDKDVFRIQMSEGDHVSFDADVPFAEDQFQISIETVYGSASLKDVSNAEAVDYSFGDPYFDELRDGYSTIEEIESVSNASWEIWAETDTTLEIRLQDVGSNADPPYDWTISMSKHRGTVGDSWADTDDQATQISPTGTYNGSISTPNDKDTFLLDLSEGDHITFDGRISATENAFQASIDVVKGTASLKNVTNAEALSYSFGDPYFDELDDGYSTIDNIERVENASWEIWAETDTTVRVTLSDSDRSSTVPYSWTLTMEQHPATTTDSWPAATENATVVSGNGTYADQLSTPNDQDTFLMQVSEGDHLSMNADFAAAERAPYVSLEVLEGTASLKNISNAEALSYSFGDPYFDELKDGYSTIEEIDSNDTASWEIWGETNALIEVTLGDSERSADVPYAWTLNSTYHPATVSDAWPDTQESASRVSPTGTYTGHLSTPNDDDVLLLELTEDENVSMQTDVPATEREFSVSLAVIAGSASLHDVSNAEAQQSSSWTSPYFDGLDDGFSTIDKITHTSPASWEVHAESNTIVAVELTDHDRNAGVYPWTLYTKLNGTINPAPDTPEVNITTSSTSPQTGEEVTFEAAPSLQDGTYEWDFTGDGETDATGETATHEFTKAAGHNVTLTVTTGAGTTATASKNIQVAESDTPSAVTNLSITGNVTDSTPTTRTVTFTLANTGESEIHGPALTINSLPANWTVASQANDGGTWEPSTQTWLWVSVAGEQSQTSEVTLQHPENVSAGTYWVNASTVHSGNKTDTTNISVTISEDSKPDSPIEALVGDSKSPSIMDVQRGIQYWTNDKTVPGTDQRLSILEIQTLIERWAAS